MLPNRPHDGQPAEAVPDDLLVVGLRLPERRILGPDPGRRVPLRHIGERRLDLGGIRAKTAHLRIEAPHVPPLNSKGNLATRQPDTPAILTSTEEPSPGLRRSRG